MKRPNRLPKPKPWEPRAQLKQRIGPGIWIDIQGAVHFSIPELLRHHGWPDNQEHRDMVRDVVQEFARLAFPGVNLMESE